MTNHTLRKRSLDSVGKFDYFVNADCELSNDPEGVTNPLQLCDIREFWCPIDEGQEVEQFVISYNYDLFYSRGADFEPVRAYLEENMLEHVATETGVIGCGTTSGRRRLIAHPEGMLGLIIIPEDVPDTRFTSCSLELDETACRPMIGGMSVELSNDADKEGILEALLDIVRVGMRDDLFVVPGTIEKIKFIEDRHVADRDIGTLESAGNQPVETGNIGDSEGDRISGIPLGISAGVVGLALLFLAAFRMTRRRKEAVELSHDELSLDGSLAERDSLALKGQPKLSVFANQKTAVAKSFSPPAQLNQTVENFSIVGLRATEEVCHPTGRATEHTNVSPNEHIKETQPGTAEELQGIAILAGTSEAAGNRSTEERTNAKEAAVGPDQGHEKIVSAVDTANVPIGNDKAQKLLSRNKHEKQTPTADPIQLRSEKTEQTKMPPMLAPSTISSRSQSARSNQSNGSSYVSGYLSDVFLSQVGSDDYETGSDCTPRRVLQMQ